MTAWKREPVTEMAIRSIRKNTKTPYRLILIDNGSTGWKGKCLPELVDIYVKLDKNRGLEYAKHVGMSFVETQYFISTDNDILAPKPEYVDGKDWLSELLKLIKDNPEYGAIAPAPQILVGTEYPFKKNSPKILEFSHIPGYLRIMDTELTKEAGAWEDKRPMRGQEEWWIAHKFANMNLKVGWASHIPCYHIFGDQNWGYGENMTPEDHGHNPVSSLPNDDWELIHKKFL